MVKEELDAKLEAHVKWLKTRFTCNVEGARADLTDADLTDADLTRAKLTDAKLTGAKLTCADLTRADLTRADLTRAHLTYADLTGVDLTGADLTDADLNIWRASPFVYEALAASFAAQMALKKTRIEWRQNH